MDTLKKKIYLRFSLSSGFILLCDRAAAALQLLWNILFRSFQERSHAKLFFCAFAELDIHMREMLQ